MKISCNIKDNESKLNEIIKDCDDIKSRKMRLGNEALVPALIYYIEVVVNNLSVEESVIGKLLARLMSMDKDDIYEYLSANALGITDVNELGSMEEVVMGIMIGDAVIFIDGYDKAIKIKSKGYPMMGLSESRSEKVTRGSREGFADALKSNTALIRKRIKTADLKVKEKILGQSTNTTVAIVYDDKRVRESVLNEIDRRLSGMEAEILTDTGIVEKLIGEKEWSLFPRYQTTERPDTAAMEIMNGRVVLLVDNTPVALILPVDITTFMRAVDDYYNKPTIVFLAKTIRYLAAFIATFLPAVYLAVINFNSELIPTRLLFSIAESRQTVPFPALIEVIIMELSFELIREAGVRVPGTLGGTIGIVGGLIVGQAAVSAGLVSPIIVIVVALTALSSFAIPSEELANSLRVLKYVMIILSSILGGLGVILGFMGIVANLSMLKSFDFPYLKSGLRFKRRQNVFGK